MGYQLDEFDILDPIGKREAKIGKRESRGLPTKGRSERIYFKGGDTHTEHFTLGEVNLETRN